jgi:hypothetical protein
MASARERLWLLLAKTDLGVSRKIELRISGITDLVVSANLDQVLLGKVAREFLWFHEDLSWHTRINSIAKATLTGLHWYVELEVGQKLRTSSSTQAENRQFRSTRESRR